MKVHLVDGTFELFRAFFGAPGAVVAGREVGAARGLLRGLAAWLRSGEVTHIGIAFDSVIESFRNQLFAGYKTGEGIDPTLHAQFPLAEQVATALGMATWPMIELEADDALATAAAALADDPAVDQIIIASPDKDLTQCVVERRVVCVDRIRGTTLDADGVRVKFGVAPASIPDWLALVGDEADGVPGLARWGARSAAQVLAEFGHIEAIPDDAAAWTCRPRGAAALAAVLCAERSQALLYKQLTTLRRDAGILCTLDHLRWRGARGDQLERICQQLGTDAASLRVPLCG
jgi:5'-3' exonuclease